MALDTDSLIDRRRLKRRLTIWRIIALVSIVAVVAVAIARTPQLPVGKHIAVLTVEGLIVSDPYRDRAVRALAEDDKTAALIIQIDSPGGTTYGSEALYRSLRKVSEVKPVVAVMNGVAASGGYMAALAADYVVARESTITGSIGVIMEATNFVGLMEKLGIESESIKSGPLKAEPNPLSRMTPEGRAAAQAIIADVHKMFVGMVSERRGMSLAEADQIADGRIYTGNMALDVGLIDGLGDDREAIAWLKSEHELDPELPLIDVEIDYPQELIDRLVSAVFGKPYLSERLSLDGLVSVWHPLMFESR
jgi:protease-4